MLDRLTLADFAGLVGSTFRARTAAPDAPPLELALTRAEALPSRPGPGRTDPFVLEFLGPPEPALAQGMVRLEHEDLDSVELFVVPVGLDETGLCYEAIFN